MSKRTPPQLCLNCGTLLDAVSEISGENLAPRPGDLTICFYCRTPMAFTDALKLRHVTTEEFDELGEYMLTLASS